MRKLLVTILILLALLLLSIPSVVGRQAEAQYQVLVTQMQMSGLRVVRNEYQRGWFGATAETELELTLPQGKDGHQTLEQPLRLVLAHRISHGPFSPEQGLLGDRLVIDTEILSAGRPLFSADNPATIQTRVALDGEGQTLIDLPAVDLPAQKGHPRIQFQGAKGDIAFSMDQGPVVVDMDMPYLQIDNRQQALLEVGNLSLDGEYWRDASGLMLGHGGLVIRHMAARSQGDVGHMEIRDLQIGVESSAEEGMVKGGINYRIASMEVEGNAYGPLNLDLRLANFSAPVLARVQQAMEEMGAQGLSPDQQGMAVVSVLMGNGAEFLQGDPRFSIERLYVETPDGVIEGRFDLQPVGLEWEEISRLDVVMNKLRAEASLRMPEVSFRGLFAQQARQALMMQLEQRRLQGAEMPALSPEQMDAQVAAMAEQQLQALLQQQVLVRTERGVETVASLDDGLLTVNGKTIPLGAMMAPPPE